MNNISSLSSSQESQTIAPISAKTKEYSDKIQRIAAYALAVTICLFFIGLAIGCPPAIVAPMSLGTEIALISSLFWGT